VGRSQPRSRASERSTESRHSEHTPSTGYSMRSAGRRHPRGVACGGSWRCAQGRQARAGHPLSLRQVSRGHSRRWPVLRPGRYHERRGERGTPGRCRAGPEAAPGTSAQPSQSAGARGSRGAQAGPGSAPLPGHGGGHERLVSIPNSVAPDGCASSRPCGWRSCRSLWLRRSSRATIQL
jgi:hypothetical protein